MKTSIVKRNLAILTMVMGFGCAQQKELSDIKTISEVASKQAGLMSLVLNEGYTATGILNGGNIQIYKKYNDHN